MGFNQIALSRDKNFAKVTLLSRVAEAVHACRPPQLNAPVATADLTAEEAPDPGSCFVELQWR